MTITAAGTTTVAKPARSGLRQLPGLDGLRAVAVLAVIVYHLDPHWLPGGYLGVDVFFVISGYLITSLLLDERRRTGRITLRRFWLRRARRLLPALAVLLVAVVILAAVFARDALAQLQGDVPAAIFYVLNWRLVFEHSTYMASFGRPPLLENLWSLSVEEQFYLLWPLALIGLRRRTSRQGVAVACLGGAGLSALLMALLYQPGDPSAVYFSTVTHASGLLLGCALAAAIPPWQMTGAITAKAKRLLERAEVGALALVVAGMAVLGFDSSATYRGGMLAVDVAATVVVATLAHPASRLGRMLSREPLRWIGLRSYSLYLWHWPIFELLRPGADVSWPVPVVDGVRLVLTFAAADASYRWVEQPWREGRAWPAIKARLGRLGVPGRAAVMAAPAVVVSVLLISAPPPDEPAILAAGSTPAARVEPGRPAPGPALAPIASIPVPTTTSVTATAGAAAAISSASPPTTTVAAAVLGPGGVPRSTEPILAVGDSVLLAASAALEATFGPDITVDAVVGRQVDAGIARLEQYRRSGALARYRTVVVDLGTNGSFTPVEFDQLAAVLAGVPRVVLYSVHAARTWSVGDNAVIQQGAATHAGQMTVVNWNAAAGAAGLLYPDGIHPDPAGAAVYTHLLQVALDPPPPSPAAAVATGATTAPAQDRLSPPPSRRG